MSSLYLNGNSWYLKSKGRRFATGFTASKFETKAQVKRAIGALPEGHELRGLIFDIMPSQKNKKVTVEFAIEEYSKTRNGLDPNGEVIDANQNRNFRRVFKSAFGRVANEFRGRYLDEITDTDILRWMQKLRSEGLKPGSIRRYVNTLSPVFTYGKSKYRGWCKDNPILDDGAVTKEMKTNKGVWSYQGREVAISDQEAFALLEASEKLSVHFSLLMHLNFNVGARRRELLTLKRSAVDLEAQRFTVLTINAKVKKERTVFYGFSSKLCALMKEACETKGLEEYIFSPTGKQPFSDTWVQKNFNKAKEGAKLPPQWTFRDFRHVAGQRMNKNGIPLNMIAEALGTSVGLLEKTYLKEPKSIAESLMMKKLAA